MTDTERVLQMLIHDVRTPIGVAQGYVRLLREERLGTPEERERALARTMDALGRISRLCDDASGFLGGDAATVPPAMAATALAACVEARVHEWDFAVERGPIDRAARVRAGIDTERLADAIGVVLATIRQSADAAPPRLRMKTAEAELQFLAAPAQRPDASGENGAPAPFDPWNGRGLAVPLACRLIGNAGGRVWRQASAIVIAFRTEAPA